jgi:hypothetical protein
MNCARCNRPMTKPYAVVGKYSFGPVCFTKMFGKKEQVKTGKRAVRVEINQLELELETV